MNYPPTSRRRQIWAEFTALALFGLPIAAASGATFTWNNTTGNWSAGGNWGGVAPLGTNPADVLVFGGDVNVPYTATNDVANPFLLDQLIFNATDAGVLGNTHFIAGSALRFAGPTPQIVANGTGGVRIDTPLQLTGPLTLTGNGTGVITLNNTITGTVDIVKNGTSTFRFGSQTIPGVPPTELPSDNAWFGTLTINDGTIRFNNNATTGRTALRANPIVLTSAGARLTVSSELRVGTLSGAAGTVETQVSGTDTENEDLIIHLTGNGSFGGTLRLGPPTGTGNDDGELIVRGSGTQTLTGPLQIQKDVLVGGNATLVLAGTASLSGQASGAIVMQGGTFRLDNSAGNADRLRPGTVDSTGLDTIGGGTFSLRGNSAGTTESLGRLQLGSVNNSQTTSTPRSGALSLNVTHDAGSTILNFTAYTRDNRSAAGNPARGVYSTVDFSANNTAGTAMLLGQFGSGPRITFASFLVPLLNSLLTNTGVGVGTPVGTNDTGWATVNGTDFATYNSASSGGSELGIQAVTTTGFPSSGTGGTTLNAALTGSGLISSGTNFSLNSLKIAPTAAGQTLSITAGGNFNNRNFILGGVHDFTIQHSGAGTGSITGSGTRYFHVQQATLNVNVSIANGATTSPLVKAGAGTLALGVSNTGLTAPVVINAGTLRSSIAHLPSGELRLRGGVYEISGGGTFSRPVTYGAGAVNWSGIDGLTVGEPTINQDRGSGGFSAIGGDATIDLGVAGPTNFAWEDKGFVNSGYALVFNSPKADSRVTWSDNLNLSSTTGALNYNAREIRVLDNPNSTTDFATISGTISGRVQDDLLKTGAGTLELSNPGNTFLGATQVQGGTLLVNGSNNTSFITAVRSGATLGGRGTVGAVRVDDGGIVAPGHLAGNASVLTTGELRLLGSNARLTFDIGGLSVGGDGTTGYDRINVNGSVILAGAQLEGTLLGAFLPAEGSLFFIISNDGSDAVNGQFAQGANVTLGGVPFEISYTGDVGLGTFLGGNDVVLRAIPEPSVGALAAASLGLLGWRRRRV